MNKLNTAILMLPLCILFNTNTSAMDLEEMPNEAIKIIEPELEKSLIDIDIKGLNLGMAYESALSFLPKITTGNIIEDTKTIYTSNSTFKEQFKYKSSITTYKPGILSRDGGERYALFFPPPPNESTVISIMRIVSYPKNKSPNKDGFINALTNKYGEPTASFPMGRTGILNLVWVYDDNNQKLHSDAFPRHIKDRCVKSAYLSEQAVSAGAYFNIFGYSEKPKGPQLACKGWTVLSAAFKTYSDGSGQLLISLIDHGKAKNAAKRSLDYFAQTEKEKEMSVKQKIEQNSPSL